MNSLERDHSDFIANSELHRYPMQCKQHRVNMTVPGCKGDTSRRGILKTLQVRKMHSWYTLEKTVAMINACHDRALYKQFSGGTRQERPDLSDILQR